MSINICNLYMQKDHFNYQWISLQLGIANCDTQFSNIDNKKRQRLRITCFVRSDEGM